MKQKVQILWFKKNLRVRDNQMLASYDPQIATIGVYFYEPDYLALPDIGQHQMQFITDCVEQLGKDLKKLNILLLTIESCLPDGLDELQKHFDVQHIFAHEETGNMYSYKRDLKVLDWCKKQSIGITEYENNGTVRRLKNRDLCSGIWNERIAKTSEYEAQVCEEKTDIPQELQSLSDQYFTKYRKIYSGNSALQKGGEKFAHAILKDFLARRSKSYMYDIGKPQESRYSASRLSTYIAVGNISIKTIYQSVKNYQAELKHSQDPGAKSHSKSLTAFLSRIHWQGHFVQRLEDEPEIEFRNLNSDFDSIRTEVNREVIERFFTGTTGIPYIDATMRQLIAIGRCNFRSRAIVISFICNTCMQPWQAIGHRLGALFADYEPGIHYGQIQMQAATTSINTIRIYNPVKNGKEKDEHADWIVKWVTELAELEPQFRHEPWKYDFFENIAYPEPIVDVEAANRYAREVLWGKMKATNREVKNKIYQKHGSRFGTMKGRKRKEIMKKIAQEEENES